MPGTGKNPYSRGTPYEPEVDDRFATLEGLSSTTAYAADGTLTQRMARITYDFAVNGGAVSTIDLGGSLPANALIRQAWVYVNTAVTSGGTPAVSFGIGASSVNLLAAADITATFTLAAHPALIPVGTAATMVFSTAGGNLKMAIGTAALTAGKFTVFLEYVVTN